MLHDNDVKKWHEEVWEFNKISTPEFQACNLSKLLVDQTFMI